MRHSVRTGSENPHANTVADQPAGGSCADRLSAGCPGVCLSDDHSLVEDEHPVGNGHQLVQVLRCDEHGGAVSPLADQPLVDVGRSRDINATRRLGDEQDRRRAGQLTGDDELLYVATGQVAGGRVQARRPHVEFGDQPLSASADGPVAEEAQAGLGRIGASHEHQVLGDGEVGNDSVTHPLFGHVGL